jgi:hypothetical protein
LDLGGRNEQEVGKEFHYEELRDFYASVNSIKIIKSRRDRWSGRVASMGKKT